MLTNFPQFIFDYDKSSYKEIEPCVRFVFHHIPKTAGSTFRALLESFYHPSQVCPAETSPELQSVSDIDKNNYMLYAGHFRYSSILKCVGDSVKVTYLRDPVERVVSQYYNHANLDRIPPSWVKRLDGRPELKQYINDVQGSSLSEWLMNRNKEVNSLSCNFQTQSFLPDEIRKEVEDWGVYNETFLDLAKRNLKSNFCFIGIQEYFDLSIDLFCMTFGLNPINASSYTTNINKGKSFGKKYDLSKTELLLLEERNSMDLELYKYVEALFFERLHLLYKPILSFNRKHVIEEMLNKRGSDLAEIKSPPFHVDIKSFFAIYGFYAEEISSQTVFRWTGYDSPSILEVLCRFEKEKKYILEIEAIASMANDVIEGLEISLDDQIVLHEVVNKGNEINIRFKVKVTEELAKSIFHQIKITSPLFKEREGEGARDLGLAIKGLSVS
ncbi:sulfotransferase family 2 domain-containing protein [Desulfogranum marinum]|uniref:sulfotransferase family 2 domain-containing protein n=1 Tax=Desulfogranum marinum TaxID=453220 RepID=UPI0019654A23|nr:sulfotransferase family 2 domain-containing protein [Desulfogranum marinum]MBM9513030.1 sulfotransferase family 2 domain-containing protein [Desulfogranum marinum]